MQPSQPIPEQPQEGQGNPAASGAVPPSPEAATSPQPQVQAPVTGSVPPMAPDPTVSQPAPVAPIAPTAPLPAQPPQPQSQIFGPQAVPPTPPSAGPQPAVTGGSFGDFGAPTGSNNNRLGIIIGIVVAVIVVAGGVGGFLLWQKGQNNPTSVFKKALANALSVKQMKETAQAGTNNAGVVLDLSDAKNPRMSTDMTIDMLGSTIKLKSYGTNQVAYINYESMGAESGSYAPILNKWIQVKKDGKLVSSSASDLNSFIDPNYFVLGEWVTGNFSAKDRQTLVDYAVKNDVYKFDTAKVTKDTVNGKAAYKYEVTYDGNKVKELNKKAAAILGLSDSDVASILSDELDSSNGEATLYVDTASKELVKVVTKDPTSSDDSTITYSYGKDVTMPTEPKADLSYDQMIQVLMNGTQQ